MKKLVMCLAVLAISIPAVAADVDFAFDSATGTLSWTINKPDTEIVGMGLNVDCTTGAIEDVTVDTFFDVFIDAAYSEPTLYDNATTPGQLGTPVALQGQAGTTTLPNAQFCLSVGHLDGTTDAAGIVLTGAGAEGQISLNTTRGGVVDQNGEALTTNLPIAFAITEPGNPCPCDVNGDGFVDGLDVQFLIPAFGSAQGDGRYNAAVDWNNDGFVDGLDVQILIPVFGTACN